MDGSWVVVCVPAGGRGTGVGGMVGGLRLVSMAAQQSGLGNVFGGPERGLFAFCGVVDWINTRAG